MAPARRDTDDRADGAGARSAPRPASWQGLTMPASGAGDEGRYGDDEEKLEHIEMLALEPRPGGDAANDGRDEGDDDDGDDDGETTAKRQRWRRRRRQSASTAASFELYTPDEERAVVRKLDRRLVVFVSLLYMASFLDRSSALLPVLSFPLPASTLSCCSVLPPILCFSLLCPAAHSSRPSTSLLPACNYVTCLPHTRWPAQSLLADTDAARLQISEMPASPAWTGTCGRRRRRATTGTSGR